MTGWFGSWYDRRGTEEPRGRFFLDSPLSPTGQISSLFQRRYIAVSVFGRN